MRCKSNRSGGKRIILLCVWYEMRMNLSTILICKEKNPIEQGSITCRTSLALELEPTQIFVPDCDIMKLPYQCTLLSRNVLTWCVITGRFCHLLAALVCCHNRRLFTIYSIGVRVSYTWTSPCHSAKLFTLWPYLIFVIFFTRAKFLENKIYTEKRQFCTLNL